MQGIDDGKKVAAIKYIRGDRAPFLLCKGRGHLAERLIRLAEEEGIPFVKDAELLDQLLVLDPGRALPEELFEVVAEILSFVYSCGSREVYENIKSQQS